MTRATTPIGWLAVAAVGEIRPGRRRDFELLDGTMLAVVNVAGTFVAFDGRCPHQGGRLDVCATRAGELHCPWHGHRWSLRDGTNLSPGSDAPARLFRTRVQDGQVEVELR